MRWTPLLAVLALLLTACPSAGTQTGQLEVTITTPAGVDGNVQITGPGGFVRILAATPPGPLSLNPGEYTITATDVTAAGTTFMGTVSVGASTGTGSTATATVAANARVSVAVVYTARAPSVAVSPSRTFTSTLGIGSLAFLPGSGAGQGRLYAAGNANTPADPSGRLYLEPSDLAGTGGSIPAGQQTPELGLARLAFSPTGTLYDLRRDDPPRVGDPPRTYINRFTRTTAVNNTFYPVELAITNGAFPYGSISDYNLRAPSDMVVDSAGNLWVLDPTSSARSAVDGIPSTPAGRLVCYSAATQSAGIPTPGNIGTPGVNYYGTAVAGASTLALDGAGNLWLAGGTGAGARLVRVQLSALRTGQTPPGACPNLEGWNPDNEVLNLGSTGVSEFSGAALTSPVDLAIFGTNLYVAQSGGTTNNILRLSTSLTSIPADILPITITGLAGNITSLAVDANGRLWVGTAGAPAPNPGRIYQLP
jgi:hypothetical protein